MASEIESATLSGWPQVTHSEVNSLFSIVILILSKNMNPFDDPKIAFKKKKHTSKIRCVYLSNPHLSFAAGFGTTLSQVAGFHRAVPSTTLDKAYMQFQVLILQIFSRLSTPKTLFFRKNCS